MPEQLFPEQQPVTPGETPAPVFPPTAAPAPDPGYAQFQNYFRSMLENDPVLRGALQQNAANTVELQRQRLKEAWGAEYNTTFKEVEAELQNIAKENPERARALADAEGAILVAQALAARKGAVPTLQAGGINRSTAPAYQAQQPLFKASDIASMSAAERRANHQAITAAYSQGLVDRNS